MTLGAQFLSIVREQLRPGSDEPYNRNELKLANVCATLQCPHPYLALASVSGPAEVWWLNAFTSAAERDAVGPAYARNEPLMTAMRPLGALKERFRVSCTSTMTSYRRDLSDGVALRIEGVRFFVVSTSHRRSGPVAAVFESPAGDLFVLAGASSRAIADDVAARFGPGAIVLAVQPQWSFPDKTWIEADPDFWNHAIG